MHKKLLSDLISLAHSILQLKNKEDVFELKDKAYQVYEKLAVLAYVEKYFKESVDTNQTKQELLDKIEFLKSESSQKEPQRHDAKKVADKQIPSLEDELKGTISADVASGLFKKPREEKTLNSISRPLIQIGLNDRIAFVKHLFDGNQQDFNRVISQLNTFSTKKEADRFIFKVIKPDYNWAEKEEYETRFINIIANRFL